MEHIILVRHLLNFITPESDFLENSLSNAASILGMVEKDFHERLLTSASMGVKSPLYRILFKPRDSCHSNIPDSWKTLLLRTLIGNQDTWVACEIVYLPMRWTEILGFRVAKN